MGRFLDLRMKYMTRPFFNYARKILPHISRTESEALESGTVNWDGELFKGRPNWKKFLSLSAPKITKQEKSFLDKEVNELCKNIDVWDITHNKFKVPEDILGYVRKNKFMGLIIPKKYGGKEMTACAQSAVFLKVGSRSPDVTSTIAVPNALGPGELILKYGTKQQKDYYLPRLAKGQEVPCFGLTGPFAGSDAGGMPDHGIVEKGTFEGKEVLGIRLTFKKRYITLAPISTLIALAFRLYDPHQLLGKKEDIGITCALVPSNLKGIKIGRRHLPLHQAFPNGPIEGKDVFIPLDRIIGGKKMAGKGWRMLMECLAVGRAMSLPTGGTMVCKTSMYTSAQYCKIRQAFHRPIGQFEGVQEKLAELAGYTLIADSTLKFTLAAIDRGEKPAVPSAISKYHVTEFSRKCILNAMDIHGGKGIIMGPHNYLARLYEANPISITIEGANILTRNMIIFGQGGTRCHPYILKEINAIQNQDIKEFDRLLFRHMGYSISNAVRSIILGLTDGLVVFLPRKVSQTKRLYQKVTRISAAFAFVADISMILLGGKLKFKESLSARLGDVLSMLYMTSAVLKKYEDDGQPKEMLPIVKWSCHYLLYEAQQALYHFLRNFPIKSIRWIMHYIIFPWGKRYRPANDQLRHTVANLLLDSEEVRQYLAQGIYMEERENNIYVKLKKTAEMVDKTWEIQKKVVQAKREKKIGGYFFDETIKQAKKEKIITSAEEKDLLKSYKAFADIINVDDFDAKELEAKTG